MRPDELTNQAITMIRNGAKHEELRQWLSKQIEDMLLIGTEPVKVKNGFSYIFCGACNLALAPRGRQKSWKYCPWCGKMVDWNAAD